THAPTVWHASGALHVTAPPAVHVPVWHVSFVSHLFPSLHDSPLPTFEYALGFKSGWHVWQVLDPFAAPAATHVVPMKQKPALSTGDGHDPLDGSHAPSV